MVGTSFQCLVKGHKARVHHVALCDASLKDEKSDKNEQETPAVNVTSNDTSPCQITILHDQVVWWPYKLLRGVLRGGYPPRTL